MSEILNQFERNQDNAFILPVSLMGFLIKYIARVVRLPGTPGLTKRKYTKLVSSIIFKMLNKFEPIWDNELIDFTSTLDEFVNQVFYLLQFFGAVLM